MCSFKLLKSLKERPLLKEEAKLRGIGITARKLDVMFAVY